MKRQGNVRIATAIALAGMTLAPAAEAAKVEVVETRGVESTAELRFQAERPEANRLTLTQGEADADHFEIVLLDRGAPVSAGNGCSGGGPPGSPVRCILHKPHRPRWDCVSKLVCMPVEGVAWSTSIGIALGDGGSSSDSSGAPDIGVTVTGGAGNDEILTARLATRSIPGPATTW